MTKTYSDILYGVKIECEKRYDSLMCNYHELKTEILEKEIAILKKKHRECENELSILEHEFIFS